MASHYLNPWWLRSSPYVASLCVKQWVDRKYFIVMVSTGVCLSVNSLAPGKFEWNFSYVILKQILVIDGCGISCEIAIIWMSLDFIDDQSTLVQVMAWCHQATSHYLSQCWPRCLSPYGITRPQWVNLGSYSCSNTVMMDCVITRVNCTDLLMVNSGIHKIPSSTNTGDIQIHSLSASKFDPALDTCTKVCHVDIYTQEANS